VPAFTGAGPQWSASGMRALFPQFVGWLLFGASVGLIVQILNDVSAKLVPEQPVNIPTPIRATRVVILGGGFAGMSTALFLECELGADRSVSSPWSVKIMLSCSLPCWRKLPAGALSRRISAPRSAPVCNGRTLCGRGSPAWTSAAAAGHGEAIAYDQLVLALGSVSNYFGYSTRLFRLQDAARCNSYSQSRDRNV
jgi:hypothetical protein